MQGDRGRALRADMGRRDIIPFIGVYDVFSASLAARHFDALFASGFSLAASQYGLPDVGFVTWMEIVGFVQRIRAVVPAHHLLVDIDDAFGDEDIAAHVVSVLESVGASGVVLEDQRRPRRCGHVDGKQLLPLEEFLIKLERVLATRESMIVVARTDATDDDERRRRARAFAKAGADAVLIDGLPDLSLLRQLRGELACPLVFNQMAGGKSPRCSLSELREAGVSLVNYSTPCLFAAHGAMEDALAALRRDDGLLPDPAAGGVGLAECNALLGENLKRERR
jgi:2-methylisocitrate lyase-like PEP mutase family enzyme